MFSVSKPLQAARAPDNKPSPLLAFVQSPNRSTKRTMTTTKIHDSPWGMEGAWKGDYLRQEETRSLLT